MAQAALFVFAHQDDEVAAASRIVWERERQRDVYCIFLTDGGAGRSTPNTRNRESAAVLQRLRVPPERIAFAGSQIPIPDGHLVEHLDEALSAVDTFMGAVDVESIYCLAWEGGHQDHDASQLVAAAYARSRGRLDRCFEMPLYNSRGLAGPFFRVLSPIRDRSPWTTRRLRMREALEYSLLAFRYPSQRGSWLGLFPESFLKLAVLRRETIRAVDPARYRERPHRGPLFYERRFGVSHDAFTRAASPFIEKFLSPARRA